MLCMYMTPGGKPPGPTRATMALTGRTRKHAGPAENKSALATLACPSV